jgi:hypothetical protein
MHLVYGLTTSVTAFIHLLIPPQMTSSPSQPAAMSGILSVTGFLTIPLI